ncbi:TadE/TadG family type IV pilus assembly protein [Candidatus Poriferisocius sp.]|uniref:TadE/TadG family type IV pilus assembly protein n=1 Tax=Candidatus Poriferisocius sp. TaxID=3101276 RepID=UPI003B02A2A2
MKNQNLQYSLVNGIPNQGSSIIGLTVLTPIMILLLFFVIAAGRIGVVESKLTSTARNAARIATQYQTTLAAKNAAITYIESALNKLEIVCHNRPKIYIQKMDLSPGGKVKIQISCTIKLSDLTLLTIPGYQTINANSTSIVDYYRGGMV